ncbi:hypothetical protein [Bacillus pseudomycoides]|uniref:hypothetical protein n=1 Tax=Bacillus pseudomycoides TaxID=64104 RepID=UPI001C54CF54
MKVTSQNDMKAKIQAEKEKIAQERQKKEPTKLEKLIISLINLDVNEKDAEKAAKYVLNKSPNLTLYPKEFSFLKRV